MEGKKTAGIVLLVVGIVVLLLSLLADVLRVGTWAGQQSGEGNTRERQIGRLHR
jgi:hypothetical protein